jgi:hypothetical protein
LAELSVLAHSPDPCPFLHSILHLSIFKHYASKDIKLLPSLNLIFKQLFIVVNNLLPYLTASAKEKREQKRSKLEEREIN